MSRLWIYFFPSSILVFYMVINTFLLLLIKCVLWHFHTHTHTHTVVWLLLLPPFYFCHQTHTSFFPRFMLLSLTRVCVLSWAWNHPVRYTIEDNDSFSQHQSGTKFSAMRLKRSYSCLTVHWLFLMQELGLQWLLLPRRWQCSALLTVFWLIPLSFHQCYLNIQGSSTNFSV